MGPKKRRLKFMLTRKQLKGMGLTDEQVESIIESHSETVDGLKDERDKLKAQAEKAESLQKDLEEAKSALESSKKDSWKVKYDALKEDFDEYKAEIESAKTKEAKEAAYKSLLAEAGVSPKRIEAILKITDLDDLELDEAGKAKDSAKHLKAIKDEWGDFIQTQSVHGADTATPQTNSGGSAMTKDEIFKIKDAKARQEAIGQNLELFQRKD
ncbi:MAG: hypothetical protein LUD72_03925 [Bacteroidales bacterium]|nr:hypothetical protein [Bacteroidales bacterium]